MAVDQYTMFRVYDRMIQRWATNVAVWKGRQVPVVLAPPDRAFAVVRDLLAREGHLPSGMDVKVIPLPFVSVSRGDPTLRLHEWQYRHIPTGFSDSSKKYATSAYWPQPFNIPYSLEIWSKYFQTDAGLTDMFLREFHSAYAYSMAKHMAPYGWKFTPMKFLSYTDNSELEGGDSDRIIRHTLNISVEGLLFFQVEEGLTAQKIIKQMYDGLDPDTAVLIEEETITQEAS
jgi:hypothetical protein